MIIVLSVWPPWQGESRTASRKVLNRWVWSSFEQPLQSRGHPSGCQGQPRSAACLLEKGICLFVWNRLGAVVADDDGGGGVTVQPIAPGCRGDLLNRLERLAFQWSRHAEEVVSFERPKAPGFAVVEDGLFGPRVAGRAEADR